MRMQGTASAHGKDAHPSSWCVTFACHCPACGRYATVQNLGTWTRGPLRYQLRASCSQQQACPAPSMGQTPADPPACSGNGACAANGTCACATGWGDLGCDVVVSPLAPGAPEAHTLAANGWMYWEITLGQDAAALTVQLTRSAGDPVLFLKRADRGFQARADAGCSATSL